MDFFDKIISIDETEKIGLLGMTDEFFSIYVDKLFKKSKRGILILTSNLYEANKLFFSIKKYSEDVLFFPMDDFLTSKSIAMSPELITTRLDTLNELSVNSRKIVISHLESYLRFLPSKELFDSSKIELSVGQSISRDNLIEQLINIGYTRETIVTNMGEYGVRGFVVDIFPINEKNPVRIEFFDDEIESIRLFDPSTQTSIESMKDIEIVPNTENLNDDVKNINIEKFMDNPIRIVKNYHQIKATYQRLLEEMTEYRYQNNEETDYMCELGDFDFSNSIFYNTVDNIFSDFKLKRVYDFSIKKVPQFHENISAINDYITNELNKGQTVVICIKEAQIKAFTKYVTCKYVMTTFNKFYENTLNIVEKEMNEGFIINNYIFLSAKELFNKTPGVKYKTRFKYTSKIKSISSLEIGDYIVHSANGIGIYNGIKTLEKNGIKKDYLEILYAGADKLYIPVEKIDIIGKYTGKEGIAPKINKLGSTEWAKTKARVRNKVHDIAKQLIDIYAKRALNKGFAFRKDDELQTMFDSDFEYDETPDQLRAISQIKEDMEQEQPMDRLLCGDVGYGKTEVAFRAMFKAVNNSKQVLYLCPTTILSNQQYNNAKRRFLNYPVNIALLNRFTTPKKSRQIIEDLNNGKIDILFGTHKILNPNIKPKDLGLLVVDEEQRFGVMHKEKIKEYKANIDVLTLSATPIPRTLQMSLVGMRSLSLIQTPPVDRYPVQTYVIEENNLLVKDAIYKEMARNGQVFILYNNIKNIENKVYEIQQLVPEARIVFAHGQLNKEEIETKMIDFINYKYDVMVCTTIIETGIDINNVNTLIIYNADAFGLSQLYQLRGRVGRSNKIAYAYLMYRKDKLLTEQAEKRLKAIKEFTELGSGFSIASRDLAIRGAGDILGSEQAGFIDSIGIDLYLKILNEEVEALKGNIITKEEDISTNNLLDVETHISDEYVEDEELKIEIHKLINTIDSYEKMQGVKKELEDRFGKISESMEIYMYEEWFEALVSKLSIYKVVQTDKQIELHFSKETTERIDGEDLFVSAIKISNNFSFSYQHDVLKLKLSLHGLDKHYIYYLTKILSKVTLK